MTKHWAGSNDTPEYTIDPKVEDRIVGQSKSMLELKQTITMVAASEAPVMVQGETGAGKELVAESIHAASGRKGELVAVNCAAIPADLLESELFGHEKGAFTGAERRRIGRIEMAEGGTLFLDEIGDMPAELQAKLLRVLESRKIQRVGGGSEIPVDFRLVTATHRALADDVSAGKFRADLYFRINVFPVEVPRLADRKNDIPLILERMIENNIEKNPKIRPPHFSIDAVRALANYNWPGNVRELRNMLERASVMFPGRVVEAEHVEHQLLGMGVIAAMPGQAHVGEGGLPDPKSFGMPQDLKSFDLRGYLRDIEAVLIESALREKEGCVSHAAEALRLQRTTLIEKMKKLGIDRTQINA